MFKKKKIIIPLSAIIILIGFRIYLPFFVENYINNVLQEMPNYTGAVKDIDISLYRGAYVINHLHLNKVNAKTEVPFLDFPKIDISLEWQALFKGAVVAEVFMDSPKLIYLLEDQKTKSNENVDVKDWTDALKNIVPLKINHLEIKKGNLAFVQISANPNIDLQFKQLYLTAENLRNVEGKEGNLPSTIHAKAISFGNGNVNISGKINIFKKIPDMDIEFSLEKSNISALNNLSNHYSGLDFESGNFEVFSEIAIANGYLKGYVKPLLTNTKLIGEEDDLLETLWEGFTGVFKFILKNKNTDTLATEIPLEGDLNKVKSNFIKTIIGILENGWIKAFKRETDGSINFKDTFSAVKNKSKNVK